MTAETALNGPMLPAASGTTKSIVILLHGYGADGKHKVKIWEDVVQAHGALGQPPVMTDNVIVVRTLLALLTQPTGFLLISFDFKLDCCRSNDTLLSISWIF